MNVSQRSVFQSFKFDPRLKQPIALRPTQAGVFLRILLAGIKAVSMLPTQVFMNRLKVDCNERIVEIPFVLQCIVPTQGMKILDFGCVESVIPLYFATLGAQVVGSDLRDYEFEHPNLVFKKGDFLENDFPDAAFDAVVAVSAVEHSGLDVYGSKVYERGDERVLEEFRRVLKPKGLLALTVAFGIPLVTRDLRIYDSNGLDQLTWGFTIRKREFFRKSETGSYWFRCREEVAGGARFDPITGVHGVALLLCEKPDQARAIPEGKRDAVSFPLTEEIA